MVEGLRDLVLETNLAVHGVPATVTRTGEAAVETSAIWVTDGLTAPTTDAAPFESALQRREPQRVLTMAASVGALPRGTLIEAPEVLGGAVRSWRIDGTLLADAEHYRVFVVPVE